MSSTPASEANKCQKFHGLKNQDTLSIINGTMNQGSTMIKPSLATEPTRFQQETPLLRRKPLQTSLVGSLSNLLLLLAKFLI